MKVKEVIEILKQIPDNYDVQIQSIYSGIVDVDEITQYPDNTVVLR